VAVIAPSYLPGDVIDESTPSGPDEVTCLAGSWSSDTPVTLTTEWVRGDAVLSTSSSYSPPERDFAPGLPRCRVTATSLEGSTVTLLDPVPVIHSLPHPEAFVEYSGYLDSRTLAANPSGAVSVPLFCTVYGRVGWCDGQIILLHGTSQVGALRFHLTTGTRSVLHVQLRSNAARHIRTHALLSAVLRVRNDYGRSASYPVVLADVRLLAPARPSS
jgi:hypothetical protein